MPQQNSFPVAMPVGYPGQRVGITGFQSRTYVNDKGALKHTVDVTITAADSTAYAFTVNGQPVNFTSGVGATTQQIRDGLIANARANGLLEGVAYLNPNGANKVRVQSTKPGVALTVAESDSNLALTTVQANSALEPIPFGLAVVKRTGSGTNETSAGLPTATGQTFLGILERTPSIVDPMGLYGSDVAPPSSRLSVGFRGTWLVRVEEAVAAEDPVYFRHTSGAGGTQPGSWRKSADSASADLVAQAKYKTSAPAGGYAQVEYNLP